MFESLISWASNVSGLSLIVFTLVIVYAIKIWLHHPADLPPIPCWPVPKFGHSLLMFPSPQKALMYWKEKMGDIFTIYNSGEANILLSSYDLIHEAFVKKADYFAERPDSIRDLIHPESRYGIVSNCGPSWKEQRSVSLAILRAFGMGKNWLAEKISLEVKQYMKILVDKGEEPQNINLLTNTAVSNVICAILLGDRFEYDDPLLVHFVQQNEVILQSILGGPIINTFPSMRHLPGDLFGVKNLTRVMKEMTKIFSEHFIKKAKEELDDTTKDNFIKGYLREMKKRKEANQETYLDERNLRRILDDLFLAGTETTSTTIIWALLYAMNFPECQKKLHEEIINTVGTDRVPNIQDKPKLNYLNGYLLETQRYCSIAPVAFPHRCNQTTELNGYKIPEGATIIPHLDALMKDKGLWGDPENFRPERFLDKDGKLDVPCYFIPFFLGRRLCLGESLAKMELFLFLGSIFQRFEILPEKPNCVPTMEPIFGGTLTPVPFKIRLRHRF